MRRSLIATVMYAALLFAALVLPINPPHGIHMAEPLGWLPPMGKRLALDLAINAVVFIPLGWGVCRSLRRADVDSATSLVGAGIIVTLFSLAVEIVQHFLPDRYSSLYDVYANAAGGIVGAAVERFAGRPNLR